MTASCLQVTRRPDGVLHLRLDRPPGNVLDGDMIAALRAAVAEVGDARVIVIEGSGDDFSYGASVEEHLPEAVRDMFQAFHGLFRDLIAVRRPILASVRGRCLGGGLELASFCHRVFARADARLGQPEVRLGVFAPLASLILPRRIGQAAADHLLLSGAHVTGQEALRLGLVDELADDPTEAALAHAGRQLAGTSRVALSYAVEAARSEMNRVILAGMDRLEQLYLDELMSHRDPLEGLNAFLEKRDPAWGHA